MSRMDWSRPAAELAAAVAPRGSRWRQEVANIPRHLLVPHWWDNPSGEHYVRYAGPLEPEQWLRAAYSDRTLTTQVGRLHADHAQVGDYPDQDKPTSSSTMPSLVVRMLQYADIYDGADVLDVATGSGYSAALLSRSLGDVHVTSVDVDPYLVEAATERLDAIGLRPRVLTADATGPLPGIYDSIVSMVSVWPIPASWLTALRPGGRLVTTLANTSLIITANRTGDDGPWAAMGRVEWERAAFMSSRSGPGYPPGIRNLFAETWEREGEEVTQGRYPVLPVNWNWELPAMLEVMAPGIEHNYETGPDGWRTARMVHADGSWARAVGQEDGLPTVHQGGPQRLWTTLDDIRHQWVVAGDLPLRGSTVLVSPEGRIRLQRGDWSAWIT